MPALNDLYSLFESISTLFDQLLATEEKKLDAIVNGDLALLDEYMKEEQAFTLKLRGYDTRREALQRELGYEGMTLLQIIAAVTDAKEKEKLRLAHSMMGERAAQLNRAMGMARESINAQLHAAKFLEDEGEGAYRHSLKLQQRPEPTRLSVEEA